MKYNILDNYSMEEIEEMLKNVIEVEEFGTDAQYMIFITDDFEELEIDMRVPEEPNAISDGIDMSTQRGL